MDFLTSMRSVSKKVHYNIIFAMNGLFIVTVRGADCEKMYFQLSSVEYAPFLHKEEHCLLWSQSPNLNIRS